ncbi:hypothetical protein D3C87_2067260 [compost metagenome]
MIDRAVFHQLGDNLPRLIGGDGEANPDTSAIRGVDGRIDTDDMAVVIHQRAAGIAMVDRRIDLDEVIIRAGMQVAAAG